MRKIILIVLVLIFGCAKEEVHFSVNYTVMASKAFPYPTEFEVFMKEYEINKAINPEYIGKLKFDSGLIVQNIARSDDNDKYLHTTWDLKEASYGSVFKDYRNKDNDQNTVYYGHYVYKDESMIFSPLHQLKDQSKYEENKYFSIYDSSGIHRYVVTDVFIYVRYDETLPFYLQNFDEATFNAYYDAVNAHNFYPIDERLTFNDRWVTFQTCVRGDKNKLLIVLAKLIETIDY